METIELLRLLMATILVGACTYVFGYNQGFSAGYRGETAPKPKQRKRRAAGGRHLALVQPQKQQRS